VHVWAVRQPDAPAETEERVREVCAELVVFERSRPPLRRHLLAPAPARWFCSASRRAALGALDPHAFDVLHLDESWETLDVPEALAARCVVHHHKLDLELARALAGAGHGPPRAVARWRRLDAAVGSRFEDHVFCSAEDARRFTARHPRVRAAVVESGVDLEAFTRGDTTREPRHLLFVGSLDYAPNLDGLASFLREGWPPLRRAFPDLRLSLVGRAPARELRRGLPEGVDLVGPVPDVRPWLRRATALVVPLSIGGGTRLKIVEALATGCPVVTTAVGVEGLSLEDGRHVHVTSGIGELVTALAEVLEDPGEARRRARAGRARVAERYSWPTLAGALSSAWEEKRQRDR